MCATCGCSEATHGHDHHHPEDDPHPHDHGRHAHAHAIEIEAAILGKNDRIAAETRESLRRRNILALNLVSSPGAGKTTLLERTIAALAHERTICVIEGDQATSYDADRIRAAGAAAIQINTGAGCHLDAAMVQRGLARLEPPPGALLFIENVGNLVCPALFDLGEREKVVISSVTEGDDKPLKYPHMFRASRLLLLNKIDLLPHVPFDVERFQRHARQVQPAIEIIPISCLRGDGLQRWFHWLRAKSVGR